MGGLNSKNSIFNEYPKDYVDIIHYKDSAFYMNDWRIAVDWFLTYFYIKAHRLFPDYQTYEVVYQIIIANKHHWRRKTVIRGVEKLNNAQNFYSERIYIARLKPIYNKFNFQAFAYAIIDDNGLRKLNFEDENVYGKSMTVLTTVENLQVPIQFINLQAPLLAKHIAKQKPLPIQFFSLEEFFQVFHGVQVQLKVKEIKSLLKISAKFQVLNVKRYCEQQLIRREDFKFSEELKFKMACRYNLNFLMNQLLTNVKTIEELGNLASIAVKTESMDTNSSKLLIAKMYKFS